MSWPALCSDMSSRILLAFDVDGQASTKDFKFTLDYRWGHFWDSIDSNLYGINLYAAEGIDLLTFQRVSSSYANKTITIQADDVAFGSRQVHIMALYYDEDTPVDITGSFTAGAPIEGYAYTAPPVSPSAVVVQGVQEALGASLPSQTVTKTTAEEILVWFNVEDLLGKSETTFTGSNKVEEILAFDYYIYDASVDQSAMREVGKCRIFEEDNGHGDRWIGVWVKGGSDGSDYTISLVIDTTITNTNTVHRTLDVRCLLKVNDPQD